MLIRICLFQQEISEISFYNQAFSQKDVRDGIKNLKTKETEYADSINNEMLKVSGRPFHNQDIILCCIIVLYKCKQITGVGATVVGFVETGGGAVGGGGKPDTYKSNKQ